MNPQPRILLLIADAMLRQTLAEHLEQVAAMTVVAPDQAHDLVVLDEALATPPGSGAPVLLLSASALPAPGIACDAVMTKPLRLSALVAKIGELLARRPAPAPMRIGPWRLDPARRALTGETGGKPVRLTDKEVALLARLARAEGQVVGREVLLADVWGYAPGMDTHTLETHIYRLRRKLATKEPGGLLPAEGGGYRLITGS